MSELKETININTKHQSFHGSLCVVQFMDHGHYISYMPSLNLTGYGDTPNEADKLLMDFVVKDFLEGLFSLEKDELIFDELKKLGWQRSPFFKKDLNKSAYVNKEGILRDFNLPAETKIESKLMSVA